MSAQAQLWTEPEREPTTDLPEPALRNLIFKGYSLVGKPKGLAWQIAETREQLAAATGVPIDICIVHDGVLEELPRLEGMTYLGRRYVGCRNWYLGSIASAQYGAPQ
jgi:hypothetical protein